jgi:tetrapyrrole methylase family protein/MazG family protein
MSDVLRSIHDKIIRRHPHVFGDMDLPGVEDVLQNWERMKADERVASGNETKSLLDGVPLALPALTQAQEIQQRAARVGFDWPDLEGVFAKVYEEIGEVRLASHQTRPSELGDLLFAAVNLSRWFDVDAESALREANSRFRRRFAFIESAARAQRRRLEDYSQDELEAFWQKAKDDE